ALMLATTLVPSGVMAQTSSQTAQDSPQAAAVQSAETDSDTGTGDSQQETCPLPTFDITTTPGASGTYSSSATVSITIGLTGLSSLRNSGYTVYYTTDGTDPESSVTGSTKKVATTGKISVKTTDASKRDTVTVKAIAIKDGYTNSQIAETSLIFESEDTAFFQDASLKKAICEALNKTYSAGISITKTEMETLTSLNLSKKDITDLTGLEAAVNLTELSLSGNPLGYSNASLKVLNSLTKLKSLDLSDCQVGGLLKKTNVGTTGINSTLLETFPQMTELETLDLSDNGILGNLVFPEKSFESLQTLDVSGNYINGLVFTNGSHKNIKSIDLSDNCYYYDESSAGFEYLVEGIGKDKVNFDDQKNLAALYSVLSSNVSITSSNYKSAAKQLISEDSATINLGNIADKNMSFAFIAYASMETVKITMNGETKPSLWSGYSNGLVNDIDPFNLEDLTTGEHEMTLTATHANGDTMKYTIKWNTTDIISSDSEDSAGITDAAVQKAVCTKLGKDWETYVVTKEDMASLTALYDGAFTITGAKDLNGLQYASNVKYLTLKNGSFTTVPDLSGMESLVNLYLSSSKCISIDEGITKLKNLTTLSLGLEKTTVLPDLSSMNLTKLVIGNTSGEAAYMKSLTSLPGLPSSLKTLEITGAASLSKWPEDMSKLSALTSVTLSGTESLTDFSALNTLPSEGQLTLSATGLKELKGLKKNATVKKLTLTKCPDLEYDKDTSFTALTSVGFNNCGLTALPDWVASGKDTLTSLGLSNNTFTDIPKQVEELTSLKSLTASGNPIGEVTLDFSKLTNLTSFNMSQCNATKWPSAVAKAENLTSLNLSENKISEVGEDIKNLTKLTTLNLEKNYLLEYPEAIKGLANLKTLNLNYNGYTSIPENAFDGMTALTTVTLGSVMKSTEGTTDTAIANLKSTNSSARVTANRLYFALLKSIDTNYGELTVNNLLEPVRAKEGVSSIIVPSGTTSIDLTPNAFYEDSTITVNGQPVETGKAITIEGLHSGINAVSLTVKNDTVNMYGTYSYGTQNYILNVLVGNKADMSSFPQEGSQYTVGYQMYKQYSGETSMASNYFTKVANVKYKKNQYYVDVVCTNPGFVPYMKYRSADGTYVFADKVEASSSSVTFRLKADNLEEDLYVSPYVTPMGYYPVCRVTFDQEDVYDVTSDAADTSDLKVAINKASNIIGGNNIYTDETFSKLEKILAEGKALLAQGPSSTAESDAMAETIEKTIAALAEDPDKIADKSELGSLIAQAKSVDKAIYTNSSYEALSEALATALEVYDDASAIKAQVEEQVAALTGAINALKLKDLTSISPQKLPDGVYTLSVSLRQGNNPASASMGNKALKQTGKLIIENGKASVVLGFHSLNYLGSDGVTRTGYLMEFDKMPKDGLALNDNNYPIWKNSLLVPGTVLDTYDVIDQYNAADSKDDRCRG
ncbi:NEAT domain-containing protein, partial [bacterium 210820-DFI.6.37]|nr:NEAT domain-containing protein [bacterium 210820-DFI.6.37]